MSAYGNSASDYIIPAMDLSTAPQATQESRAARATTAEIVTDMADLLGTDEHPFGRTFRPLSVKEAEEIASMSDAVRRNLRITQGYHDLKMDLTRLLGSKNVSWCAFATWASRTAGHFIRGEFVPGIATAYLDHVKLFHRSIHTTHRVLTGVQRTEPLTRSVLVECVERVTRQVIENVAVGNLIVFEELGPLYARMIEHFGNATTYDPHALRRFLSVLKPGPVQEGGQDLLISAFTAYYRAMFEKNPKKKAELILLANNQVGYHEQTRLQDPIVNSLNAPIAEIILHAAHERARQITPVRMQKTVEALVDRALWPLYTWLQREWYAVATRWLMRIDLPTPQFMHTRELICLSLGVDLPYMDPEMMFPQELLRIEDKELSALLYALDFTPNTTSGSAASNWGDLADRMNFVVDFFRTRQQDANLYQQPFTDEQVLAIREGDVPGGPPL